MRVRKTLLVMALTLAASGAGAGVAGATPGPTPDQGLTGACNMTNTNAAFDFAGELITAKTLSEVIELSSAHTRKQFEAYTEQGKELTALAQKVATDSAEPIKSGMNRAFSKVG